MQSKVSVMRRALEDGGADDGRPSTRHSKNIGVKWDDSVVENDGDSAQRLHLVRHPCVVGCICACISHIISVLLAAFAKIEDKMHDMSLTVYEWSRRTKTNNSRV